MEKIVRASRAPVFKLIVLSDSKKSKTRKPKVLSNDHIVKVSELGRQVKIFLFYCLVRGVGSLQFLSAAENEKPEVRHIRTRGRDDF